MTEAEWATSTDWWRMLHTVNDRKPSARKMLLYNAASCRRLWSMVPPASQAILEECERIAERCEDPPGPTTMDSVHYELCRRANVVVADIDRLYPDKRFPDATIAAQRSMAAAVCYAVLPELWGAGGCIDEVDLRERDYHPQLIREVFGNPFHDRTGGTTRELATEAQLIYDTRAFDRLPQLAAALLDMGFSDQELLDHLRQQNQHVRGCWALDRLIGKR